MAKSSPPWCLRTQRSVTSYDLRYGWQAPNALVRVGKRGTLVIPAAIRTRLGITEGQLLELPISDHALLIQPVLDSRLERFREAFGPFFEGVDPVEFQRGFRDETTQLQRARTPGRSTRAEAAAER